MMKSLNTLFRLTGVALLALAIGCSSDDNGVSSNDEALTLSQEELENEATASFEYSSYDAAGVDPIDKDAIFSVGWGKFYNPMDEEVQERSDAFAVAPDLESDNDGFRPRFGGFDMGTVTLNYGSESLELFKIELRNGGVFYNYGKRRPGNPRGMLHDDEGEVSEAIPYLPGETYRFDATGSDVFPAASMAITASTEALQVTSPTSDAQLDSTAGLVVAWQGGEAGQALMVGLVPLLDRASFERDHGRRGGGPPNGGPNGDPNGDPNGNPGGNGNGFGDRFSGGPDGRGGGHGDGGGPGHRGPGRNPDLHFRYLVEDNTGSFTVPAEDIAKLLSHDGVLGVLVQVMQMTTVESTDDTNYAIQLRAGDAVQLSISE